MNIKEHKKKGVFGLFMPLSELEAYYREERAKRFYENRPLQGIKWCRKLYSLIAGLFKLSATLAGQKLTIIRDCRKATDKPVIYACTHIGRYDIEMAFRVIRESCWYLWGDPGSLYKNPEGILVWLMGRIFVDTAYKEDRYIGKETCVRLLEEGGTF